MTIETFDQSDEETLPDQQKDNHNHKDKTIEKPHTNKKMAITETWQWKFSYKTIPAMIDVIDTCELL